MYLRTGGPEPVVMEPAELQRNSMHKCVKLEAAGNGLTLNMGFEREQYVYCRRAAAMAVSSPRGVQSSRGGELRV